MKVFITVLKVVGVAFGVLVVALGVLLAVFWDQAVVRGQNLYAIFTEEPEYAEGFADREEFLEYLKAHPDDYSVVAYTASDDSDPSRIERKADEPMPLGSTKKIIVLAAYAKEVSEGNLDPEQEVPVSGWEEFYIPNTDGGAHPNALQALEIPTNEEGFARDPEESVTLDDVAQAMISVSDNAATDYLIQELGREKIRSVIEEENLEGQDEVLPLSGGMLLNYGRDGDGTPGLSRMSDEEYAEESYRASEAYANGEYPEEWREGRAPLGSLPRQRSVGAEFETRGSAQDYALVMDGVSDGEFISPEASEIMSKHLEWPMKDPANKRKFDTLGAKGGSIPGVFTQAMYAVPKEGGYAGEDRVVVLFVREMSASAWLGVQQSEGYGDFVNSLLDDRDFAEKVRRELEAE